jgi:hypothetical protein
MSLDTFIVISTSIISMITIILFQLLLLIIEKIIIKFKLVVLSERKSKFLINIISKANHRALSPYLAIILLIIFSAGNIATKRVLAISSQILIIRSWCGTIIDSHSTCIFVSALY